MITALASVIVVLLGLLINARLEYKQRISEMESSHEDHLTRVHTAAFRAGMLEGVGIGKRQESLRRMTDKSKT